MICRRFSVVKGYDEQTLCQPFNSINQVCRSQSCGMIKAIHSFICSLRNLGEDPHLKSRHLYSLVREALHTYPAAIVDLVRMSTGSRWTRGPSMRLLSNWQSTSKTVTFRLEARPEVDQIVAPAVPQVRDWHTISRMKVPKSVIFACRSSWRAICRFQGAD